MATSSRVKLLSPLRLWVLMNVLTLIFLFAAGFNILQLTKIENQKLLSIEFDTLVKAGAEPLTHGDYRKFIELTGEHFDDVSVRINSRGFDYSSGKQLPHPICQRKDISTGLDSHLITVELCRSSEPPLPKMVLLMAVFLILSISSFFLISQMEKSAVQALRDLLRSTGMNVPQRMNLLDAVSEIQNVQGRLNELKLEEINFARAQEQNLLAAEVAHDIRSPLTALTMISNGLVDKESDEFILLQKAIRRIQSIAEELLAKHRGSVSVKRAAVPMFAPSEMTASRDLVSVALIPLLEAILAEKRIEFSGRPETAILGLTNESPGKDFFVRLEESDFQRVLSNLLNNSFEALTTGGWISCSVGEENGEAVIVIRDNGPGIDQSVIQSLDSGQPISTKPRGSGLGLSSSKIKVQGWGGRLKVFSELGRGTAISIFLPING